MQTVRETLPDASNGWLCLRYLQEQAAMGAFEGHTSAYLVMLYFVMNMWTKADNPDGGGIGDVLYRRASIAEIAKHTTLCRATVKTAMKWLFNEGWIDTERSRDKTGREDRRYITVLMDTRAHCERARRRGGVSI